MRSPFRAPLPNSPRSITAVQAALLLRPRTVRQHYMIMAVIYPNKQVRACVDLIPRISISI